MSYLNLVLGVQVYGGRMFSVSQLLQKNALLMFLRRLLILELLFLILVSITDLRKNGSEDASLNL